MRSAPLCLAALLLIAPLGAAPGNRIVANLEPTPENPRNSEGSFATLKSGRILFCYSQFYGGHQDESPARIAEIHSDNRGLTWSQPRPLFENGSNQNVMSVSLLRLASGKLAVFYAVKRDAWRDCRPVMRVSSDEGASWSDPRPVISAPGYFVLNNDRVIQSSKGRLIAPVAFHRLRGMADERASFDPRAITLWYLSDDEGMSWREASSWWAMPVPSRSGLQEPGVVELADGSLFSWARTDQGCQFGFRSRDGGDTWSPPEPTEMKSPVSPSSIRRLPGSGSLLAVYNDHSGRYLFPGGRRTPLVAALSDDGGATWPKVRVLEDDPSGWYCYTAIHFVDDAVLLGYCAGDYPGHGLDRLRIRRFDLAWLSELQAPAPDALAARARSILHRIVASDQTFVKIHAAESLTPFGEAEPVRRLFLAERPRNEESVYRVGVWRVLSATAHSEAERAQWVRKVEEVFLAPAYPNRIQALETLCKVRDRLGGKTLEAARELAAGKNPSDEVMALWALQISGEPGALPRLTAALGSGDPEVRVRAGYALRWLHPSDPAALRALAAAADAEQPQTRAYPYIVGAAFSSGADPARMAAWRAKLMGILDRGSEDARFEACQGLMPSLTQADLPRLAALLDENESDTRIGAARGILFLESHPGR